MTNLIYAVLTLVCAQTESSAPAWWEMETRMEHGGKLSLSQKPWWDRAIQLKTGEWFVVKSEYSGGGMSIVRREQRTRAKDSMIVWILDDDGDMNPADPQGDADNDCYIADYGGDGSADRMVDWIDADSDGMPDEMDIRYFVNGELRRAWFGVDLDRDGKMWNLADYEYPGDFFSCDPYGNNEIFMNKYNPNTNAWLPISECPFSFYDSNGDGESDVVVRFSAAPLEFSPVADPDYANSTERFQGPFDPIMERMGVVNVRYSFDIDGLSSKESPLHYEMGFTMTGSLPYQFDGMNRYQPLRREPKTTVCVPYDLARDVSERFVADRTGFTWREYEDAAMKIGGPPHPDLDRRWEGVFWTWRRQPLHNTGGPVQDWNVRREYVPAPTSQRELYYSPIDRRFHCKGATEGWIQIGHIGNDQPLGEIRLFDSSGDGYFDRWEYYRYPSKEPYRVATVANAGNRDFANRWPEIQAFYTQQALPDAIRLNEELIAAIGGLGKEFVPDIPENLIHALQCKNSPDEKRFLLDWMRELYYAQFRAVMQNRIQTGWEINATKEFRSTQPDNPSIPPWDLSTRLAQIDAEYEQGKFEEAIDMISNLKIN